MMIEKCWLLSTLPTRLIGSMSYPSGCDVMVRPMNVQRHFLRNAFCYLCTYITCTKIRNQPPYGTIFALISETWIIFLILNLKKRIFLLWLLVDSNLSPIICFINIHFIFLTSYIYIFVTYLCIIICLLYSKLCALNII